MKKTADVIIIGGGIIGLSIAYHLAEKEAGNITVLERDLLAQASTGLSLGGIRQQFFHPDNIQLSQASLKVFENFKRDFGVDINFRQAGYLFLIQQPDTWTDFLSAAELQKELGVPIEVLSPEEIKKGWPYINTEGLQGGTFGSADGYADPYQAAMGYAKACRNLGVSIREKTEVIDLMIDNGQVSGVETSSGNISAPVVVNAAGAWAAQVGKMAGVDLPVNPYRRQAFMTKAFDLIPKPVPLVIDQDKAFYFRGEDPGIIMGMSDHDEPSSFRTHTDREFLERVIEAAVLRAPVLEQARIMRGWGGLYAITPDSNPIIDALPIEGLYCAIGFSGHGFQHGPAVGQIMADLILKGEASFDRKPFLYKRFDKPLATGEKSVI
jgi:sarcosine oxidase, subunit beta